MHKLTKNLSWLRVQNSLTRHYCLAGKSTPKTLPVMCFCALLLLYFVFLVEEMFGMVRDHAHLLPCSYSLLSLNKKA